MNGNSRVTEELSTSITEINVACTPTCIAIGCWIKQTEPTPGAGQGKVEQTGLMIKRTGQGATIR